MEPAICLDAPARVSYAVSAAATAPPADRPAALVVRLAIWYVGIFAALAVALQPSVIVIDRAARATSPAPVATAAP